ncbi:MAG TPA: glycosyltransferase family 1 protein [Thermoanaerobaculaceae bacterium]|nr:glycosyltransferase family 1 protein [Thermoanaerobaculaceae bacterium]
MSRRLRVTALFFMHLLRDLAGTLVARLRRSYRRVVLGEESLAVGVDIFPFFERMTGVGWYEWNLLARLPEVDAQVELRFYAQTFGAPDEPPPPLLPTSVRSRFRFHHMPQGFLLPVRPTMCLLRLIAEPLLLFLDGNDVFFAPNFFVPRRHLAAVRSLVPTVHDLAFLRLPNTVQRETLDNLNRHLPGVLFAADALIAVSAATAGDLEGVAGVSARRVHVIHEGVDPSFFTPHPKPPFGLPARYLLFVSTLEPRKNVVNLLEGFARAAAAGYPGELLLVGRWGWHTESAQQALECSPVRDRIRHLDYLDREALNGVMRGAEALVFPSLLEGFGLPVVEAMACGVPVIVSRASSLPEVAGEAGLYVDPACPAEIASAIVRLASDPDLRDTLASAGRERARHFRWEETARATAAVLRRAGGLPERFADAYRV